MQQKSYTDKGVAFTMLSDYGPRGQKGEKLRELRCRSARTVDEISSKSEDLDETGPLKTLQSSNENLQQITGSPRL